MTATPNAFAILLLCLPLGLCAAPAEARQTRPATARPSPPPAVAFDRQRGLTYAVDARGERVPDFSHCGYAGGERDIPLAPARVLVKPAPGDQTRRIQSAIDYVATLPLDSNGLRGAVLLAPGRFEVAGALSIKASGVVLRGSGAQTQLVATGTDRRTLVTIAGRDDAALGPTMHVADERVPVNATTLRVVVDPAQPPLRAGDRVRIVRPSTEAWIHQLGMHDMGGDRHGFSWRPGSRDIAWERTILAARGDEIEFDAPITLAIEHALGGATVQRVDWPGLVQNVGVENLAMVSEVNPDNPKDEDHAWHAVVVAAARDAWVRQVSASHFAGGAVVVWETASRVTVEDCLSLAPVSEIGGWRRHAFFTAGQLTLFKHCFSELARHDFAVGFAAAGPNAFVQCESSKSLGDSGPIDSAASGVLYDGVRVDGAALALENRHSANQGAGWCAFNSVLWNCSAAVVRNFSPPGASNWAFGAWGEFAGDGSWIGSNGYVDPLSLYAEQARQRLGDAAHRRVDLMDFSTDASSSPTPEKAAELAAASTKPATTFRDWIASAARRRPIPVDSTGVPEVESVAAASPPVANDAHADASPVAVVDGRITLGGRLLEGARQPVQWWRGSARPNLAAGVGSDPAVTRFMPGRVGPGATDDLPALAEAMRREGKVMLEHNHGLWYDRRRDDHQRVRRMNGDVAAPFFEQPFARTGGDALAWDGLSKYDLTKFNPWYWSRLRQFADLCDRRGLILLHQQYFQHNILEAGAHYADFPWRTANNVNHTGFPEPPLYAGDKRIFMAEPFYDVSHPTRRALHRAYIRQCLDNFRANTNVFQSIGEEFTGPLHFVQFWIDTIAEWQRETGRDAVVVLGVTKDVQDAILADRARAEVVDVIDIRYWWYQQDGQLYAPPGGGNLAPRQWARVLKPKPPSAEQAARAVSEYRRRYPEKAVIYSVDGADRFADAIRNAGGSLPASGEARQP